MDIIFEKIKKKYNASIESKKSSWFNGRAYFPLYHHKMYFKIDFWDIIINYEYRVSEFQQKQYIDGGTFNDRHIYEIFLTPNTISSDYPKFRIEEKGFFSRFYNKNKYSCKSNNTSFLMYLKSLEDLEKIFLIEDSEFSPSIIGMIEGEKYFIRMNYNLSKNDENILLLNIDCLIKIAKQMVMVQIS
jgi:hypothetical protein